MARYLLSESSYICIADRHAVFLDLAKDRYTALNPEDTQFLRTVVSGLPGADEPDTDGNQPKSTSSDIIDLLLNEGLITDSEILGKAAVPIELEHATTDILAPYAPIPTIAPHDLLHFTCAWLQITIALRVLPLRRSLLRIRSRKRRNQSASFNITEARRLLVTYLILRPNFFSNVDACLRDSLTLVEFFSRYNLYPTCVLGVKMNPFAAHAWVQEGDFSITDYARDLTKYTPILAI